ncbi:tetratricopeptide repeat protein [Streptomyces specialis]|uniref:tetratricopeptide repeat protein n=1 Tax=Streptomyces specialis TaxID=498367 RepID=UPI00073E6B31|nr:tetratricopeptide repeat protein [Streptomyces specialis]
MDALLNIPTGTGSETGASGGAGAAPGGGEDTVSVVVIAGTAGVGKTSLAVRLAHRISGRFPDGQLFVNLHGYDSGPPVAPQAALERFLRALGVPPQGIPDGLEERTELFRSLLAGRRVLVVLDNAATPGQVRPLLPGTGGCLTLVTSRHRLSGLAVRDGARRLTLGMLSERESADLITQATRGYRTGDDPADVAELARLCAHLPLALRIAAERAAARPLVPLRELIAQLRDESALWDALSSPDEEEADAVRPVFAWSSRALPPAASRLFRLLGLHPGPDVPVLAAAALADQEPGRARSLLDLLAGAHLIEQTAPERYQFHDLLRAYAADQAHQHEPPDDQHAAVERLASWYLHAADAARGAAQHYHASVLTTHPSPKLPVPAFAGRAEALRWYHAERANLLTVTRAAADAGLDTIAWQLPATLHALHETINPADDWPAMARTGLDAATRLDDLHAQALMHNTLAIAHRTSQRLDQAAEHHEAALALRTRTGDTAGVAQSTNGLGVIHMQRRQHDQARDYLQQAITLYRRQDNPLRAAVSQCCLAYTEVGAGNTEHAKQLARQVLQTYRAMDADPPFHADILCLLARIDRQAGRLDQAHEHIDEALTMAERTNTPVIDGLVRLEHAHLLQAQGHHDQALTTYRECITILRTVGNTRDQALAYDGIGQTMRALGRPDQAADFHRTAARLLRDHHHPWHLALTLTHLADAHTDNHQPDHAHQCRTEALTLLAEFTDPEATALRDHLQALTRE